MTRKELRAEILTLLKKYDDLGLVDYITLDNTIKNELMKFGSNVMEKRAEVIEISGGQADLPTGFFKLNLAMTCQPYEVEPIEEVDTLWRTDYAMSKRIINNYEWDNMSNTHYKKSYKEIIEKKEIRGSKIYFKHKPVEILALTKDIPKDFISDSSVNKVVRYVQGASQINIKPTKIQTNFREGFIYLEYDGLPEQDGDLIIPNIPALQDYLKYYCAYRALESIWTNGEATDVADKIAYYKNEADTFKASAMTATKFEALPSDWHKKMAINNRKNLRKFYR